MNVLILCILKRILKKYNMKIATITLFCNERFRLDNWLQYYSEYKDDVYLHVIVNNGTHSDTEYLKQLFPESLVLYSPTKNMISSYNLGLQEILKDKEVDAISQITNDIKLSECGFSRLYNFLYSNEHYGMVSPILFNKDSDVICQYGSTINMWNMSYNHNFANCHADEIKDRYMECSGLPGGINLGKRKMYEKIGFQDEQIYMYADETDLGIRIKEAGYVLAVTSDVQAWHQHVNLPGRKLRNPRAAFFMGRNHIYIAKKYFGEKVIICTFLYNIRKVVIYFIACIVHNRSREEYVYNWYFLCGIWKALCNDFNNDFNN